ncbi:hypothetical protein GPECTOR_1g499 [Gonium pectorale]|uniref:Glycosyltransferase family 92 protein n=1 Tax=Gonium pectorale TaxID=33097 RepID=A0A150H3G0_GONPE|nr:hypothetical protein GPECTOR_1g499 [Gonium pectorale]|eukprot:KXZ56555.1 hypothetical protein GPECTOR_1g499 [Gonium pectorale]
MQGALRRCPGECLLALTAIRALVWVDDVENLHLRTFGHIALPTAHQVWHPKLLLETEDPGPVVRATVETRPELFRHIGLWRLRPYSLRFDLPEGTEGQLCFRLVESSYPTHKVSVCIPHEDFSSGGNRRSGVGGASGRARVCEALAPSSRTNASAPALWTAIGPPRHSSSSRNWQGHFSEVAVRTAHYLSYHITVGVSGLLLYTDQLTRFYLRRHPAVVPYLRSGHLRLIAWDMPERSHKSSEPPGRGGWQSEGTERGLGYNYDQALFASHALLGLSACGANLMLLVTDMDEYLHTPEPRQGEKRWPTQMATCLPKAQAGRGRNGGRTEYVSVRTLQRYELVTSVMTAGAEFRLWTSMALPNVSRPSQQTAAAAMAAAAAAAGVSAEAAAAAAAAAAAGAGTATAVQAVLPAGAGGGGGAQPRRMRLPMPSLHNKLLMVPAAEIVAFFVHDSIPRHGQTKLVDKSCLVLLHVTNYWRPRIDSNKRTGFFFMKRNFFAQHSWEPSPLRRYFTQNGSAVKAA